MRPTARGLTIQPLFLFHLFAALFVWVFVWLHAFDMDFVYDEATSFYFLKVGHYRPLPGVANTHWLNSLFIRLIMTFNESVIALRLHSILSFPFFAHGIYRLATLVKSGGGRFAFYCLIIFNPYLLEFFSLARGYGMALTFQVWTILFFIQAVHTGFNYRRWMQIIILSALTLGAHLSYQYTIMAVAGGYLLYCGITDSPFSWYTNKQKRKITWLFVLLLFFSTVDLLIIKFIGKDLELGGKENFLRSVFDTFWVNSLYMASYTHLSVWLSWLTLLLLVTASIYFAKKAMQQKKPTTGMVITFITCSIFILCIVFHLVFGTPYMARRTALQWYVPGLLTIFLATAEWQLPVKKHHFFSHGLGVITGMLVIFHFVITYNSSRNMEYYREDRPSQPLYDLYAQHPKHPGISILMAGTYQGYYSQVDSLIPRAVTLHEHATRPLDSKAIKVLNECDYIIYHTNTTIRFLDSSHIPYTIVKSYAGSNFKILRLYH